MLTFSKAQVETAARAVFKKHVDFPRGSWRPSFESAAPEIRGFCYDIAKNVLRSIGSLPGEKAADSSQATKQKISKDS